MKNKNCNTLGEKMIVIIIFILSFTANLFAQGESDFTASYYDTIAIILLIFVFIALLSIIYFEGHKQPVEMKKSLFARFRQFVTKSAPIEKENEIIHLVIYQYNNHYEKAG